MQLETINHRRQLNATEKGVPEQLDTPGVDRKLSEICPTGTRNPGKNLSCVMGRYKEKDAGDSQIV